MARVLALLPQVSIGAGAKGWLPQIEAQMPRIASAPVRKPAFDPALFIPPVPAGQK